mmetsp:Transcript_26265/g.66878  ORF Transcript_26265/g.66878 Transcript_26265/m.66878 type:complete len:389 (+) Transcript_26265:617-1783(+)
MHPCTTLRTKPAPRAAAADSHKHRIATRLRVVGRAVRLLPLASARAAVELGGERASLELLHQDLVQLLQLEHAVHHVVARAHVDGARLALLLAHHQDVVVLRQLRLTHLLLHLAVGAVGVDVHAQRAHRGAHLARVLVRGLADGHHHDLARVEPEGPLARVVLGEDRKHALHAAQHRAVHNHRALRLGLLGDVLEVEADGQLEVKLHGGALELALERVVHRDVDLGAVERAVGLVDGPGPAGGVERVGERGLRLVPLLQLAQVRLGARGQRHGVVEPKHAVHLAQELEEALHLGHDLVGAAEDVRVVLREAAHAEQAVHGARPLVPVHRAQLSHADGQVAVRVVSLLVDAHMEGAVHGLDLVLLILNLHLVKHRLLVKVKVARRLPQV